MKIAGVVFVSFTMTTALHTAASLSSDSRVALVTGANKGIGKEIAKKLVNDARITTTILACRTNGEQTASELVGCPGNSVYLDLTDTSSIDKAAAFVKENYGKLDVLINNAAICFNDPTLYGKVPYTSFEQQAGITIDTNYFGTSYVIQSMLPLLKSSSSPRIINIASSAGRLGILRSDDKIRMFTAPDLTMAQMEIYMRDFVNAVESGSHAQQGWPNTCYGMSKLGLIALTKILARENPEIMVNSVDPGYCATDQNNHQGTRPAGRGAVTPFLLATLDAESSTDGGYTGKHWFDEREIKW